MSDSCSPCSRILLTADQLNDTHLLQRLIERCDAYHRLPTDIELRVDTKCVLHAHESFYVPVRAHRVKLAEASAFFNAMLFNRAFIESELDHVHLRDGTVDAYTLSLFVYNTYAQNENCTLAFIKAENVDRIMITADYLLADDLMSVCERYLAYTTLTPSTAAHALHIAQDYALQGLETAAFNYLLNNAQLWFDNEETLCQLTYTDLDKLISSDFLQTGDREMEIALLGKWKQLHQISNTDKYTNTLFNHLWLKTSNFHRNGYSARLPSRLILAIGGWSGSDPSGHVEAYDYQLDKWCDVQSFFDTLLRQQNDVALTRSIGPISRAYHSCIVYPRASESIGAVTPAKIYQIGGYDGEELYSSVRSFDLSTKHWQVCANMSLRRGYVSAVAYNGHIYACGGKTSQEPFQTRTNTVECYDPLANQWRDCASMNNIRSDAHAAVLDDHMYIVGGYAGMFNPNGDSGCLRTVDSYSFEENRWVQLTRPMPGKRSGGKCIAMQRAIYICGGFDGSNRLRDLIYYDPREGRFHSDADSMLTTRSNFGIEALNDYRFLVTGGYDGQTTTDTCEIYDIRGDCWIQARPMKQHRSALFCVPLDVDLLTKSDYRQLCAKRRPWATSDANDDDDSDYFSDTDSYHD